MNPKVRPPPLCKDTLDYFGDVVKIRATPQMLKCSGSYL